MRAAPFLFALSLFVSLLLYAESTPREALLALYGFNYEVARVREVVSEPMLGHIRLQWWRDVISAAFSGEPPRRH